MPYTPTDPVTSEDVIRANSRGAYLPQRTKILDHIDALCRLWIERSPFMVMATHDAGGRVDVSPRGDPPGFVRVVDTKTLAVPDRPGNHRYDSFANIIATGRIGMVFFVPNRNEVVRVNGGAQIVRDLPLRESLAIHGRVPDYAIVVRVEEAFFHCGKAVIRSGLWAPAEAAPTDGLPTYAEALMAQAEVDVSLAELEAHLKNNEERRLYEE
jgi:PPOX class probable FMN-dependent enzyme